MRRISSSRNLLALAAVVVPSLFLNATAAAGTDTSDPASPDDEAVVPAEKMAEARVDDDSPAAKAQLDAAIAQGALTNGRKPSAQESATLRRSAALYEFEASDGDSLTVVSSDANLKVAQPDDWDQAIQDGTLEFLTPETGDSASQGAGRAAYPPQSGWVPVYTFNGQHINGSYTRFFNLETRRARNWDPQTGYNCGKNCKTFDAMAVRITGSSSSTGYRYLWMRWVPQGTYSGRIFVDVEPKNPVWGGSGTNCITTSIGGQVGVTSAPWSIGFTGSYSRQACTPNEVTSGQIRNGTTGEFETSWERSNSVPALVAASTTAGSSMFQTPGNVTFGFSYTTGMAGSSSI